MKILFIAGSLGKGGAEKQLFYLCKILKNNDYDVKVACLTQGEYFENEIRKLNVEVVYIGKSNNKFQRLYEVYKLVRKFNPKLIYGFHFYTGFYAGFVGRITNTLSFGSIRSDGNVEKRENGLFSWLHFSFPTKIIANSVHGLENAKKIFYTKELDILPNIIDLDFYNFEKKERGTVLHLLFIGSLKKVKQPHLFIELVAELHSKGIVVEGKVIGKGVLEQQLKILAKDLPVEFMGNIDDVRPYLENADYLISTSLFEGTPNVILEAIATRTPVFALYHEGILSWIEKGLLLRTNTLVEIEQKIISNKTNDTQAARNYIQNNHSFRETLDKFERLIEK